MNGGPEANAKEKEKVAEGEDGNQRFNTRAMERSQRS